MKAIDLTKITSEERLQQVHAKIDELQARLDRELQVIIYSSIHHPEDMFDGLADSLRLSVVSFAQAMVARREVRGEGEGRKAR